MNADNHRLHAATTVSIRAAVAADAAAVERLAQLEGERSPDGLRMLVAEVEGKVRAALPLDGGAGLADPFHPTAHLLEMLRLRAKQLDSPAPRPGIRTRIGLRRARRPGVGPAAPVEPAC